MYGMGTYIKFLCNEINWIYHEKMFGLGELDIAMRGTLINNIFLHDGCHSVPVLGISEPVADIVISRPGAAEPKFGSNCATRPKPTITRHSDYLHRRRALNGLCTRKPCCISGSSFHSSENSNDVPSPVPPFCCHWVHNPNLISSLLMQCSKQPYDPVIVELGAGPRSPGPLVPVQHRWRVVGG